ncbi:hypothetical protein HKX48_007478 [Thoreauomyces humboldtii]|nr:hypothetical protein HKX48_007478 [Thoreauomyces humboldtii]
MMLAGRPGSPSSPIALPSQFLPPLKSLLQLLNAWDPSTPEPTLDRISTCLSRVLTVAESLPPGHDLRGHVEDLEEAVRLLSDSDARHCVVVTGALIAKVHEMRTVTMSLGVSIERTVSRSKRPQPGDTARDKLLEAHRTELSTLRHSLSTLQRDFLTLHKTAAKEIQTLRSQLSTIAQRPILVPETTTRTTLPETLSETDAVLTDLERRVTATLDVLTLHVTDVRTRRVRSHPSHSLAMAETVSDLDARARKVREGLDRAKGGWKKAWADELDGIVAEETGVRAVDSRCDVVRASVDRLRELSVLEGSADDDGGPGRGTTSPTVPSASFLPFEVLSAEEAAEVHLEPVLEELRSTFRSSGEDTGAERLSSLERWTRLQRWRRDAEQAHGATFANAIRGARLTKGTSGGLEEVERTRREKDAANLRNLRAGYL